MQASQSSSVRVDQQPNNKLVWSEHISDYIQALDSYNPTIPEAISKYYLEKAGVTIKDKRICKLVSLAADKFLADTLYDAKQLSLVRLQAVKNAKRKAELIDTLEVDDLAGSVGQNRILLRRKITKVIAESS
eukprot:gene7901-10724_t